MELSEHEGGGGIEALDQEGKGGGWRRHNKKGADESSKTEDVKE